MRKRILEGIAGIGLLAVLPACSTQKQAIMPEDVYAVARTVQTGTEQEAGSDKQRRNKITIQKQRRYYAPTFLELSKFMTKKLLKKK